MFPQTDMDCRWNRHEQEYNQYRQSLPRNQMDMIDRTLFEIQNKNEAYIHIYTNLTFTVASSVFRNARAGVVCAATTNNTGSSIQACVIGLTNVCRNTSIAVRVGLFTQWTRQTTHYRNYYVLL